MSFDQLVSLAVLIGVVAALIWGRFRSDAVALTGAAVLVGAGVVRPAEIQGAFASPALTALASLFVIAYAMELSGLIGAMIRLAVRLCRSRGAAGVWLVVLLCGGLSAFLNNTPIVVLASPVVRDVSRSLGLSPRRFLIPLSYATILGGVCTLIGTSTNLLVNDMARNAGQPAFGMFEATPVALIIAVTGGLYLFLFGGRLLAARGKGQAEIIQAPPDALGDDPGDRRDRRRLLAGRLLLRGERRGNRKRQRGGDERVAKSHAFSPFPAAIRRLPRPSRGRCRCRRRIRCGRCRNCRRPSARILRPA